MKSLPLRAHEAAAYAAGRLTQIRRVIKTGKLDQSHWQLTAVGDFIIRQNIDNVVLETPCGRPSKAMQDRVIRCPYGAPGDRLALREGFWVEHDFTDAEYGYGEDLGPCLDYERPVQYCASPEYLDPPKDGQQVIPHEKCEPGNWWLSPPDDWDGERNYSGSGVWVFLPWGAHSKLSAARMPLWAVRWHPVITAVRLERVQEITEADARACGIVDGGCLNCGESEPCGCHSPQPDARDSYIWQFDRDNPRTPWDSNPWTWVIDVEGNTK